MHITTPISNPSNIYSVERLHDENVTNNLQYQTTPSGLKYYTIIITPNDYNQLLGAGNFIIDGLSSSWVYNATLHPLHPSKCYPQTPPWYGTSVGKNVRHSTPHSYVLKGDGTMGNTFGPPNTPGLNVPCWGPNSQTGQNFTGNGTYRFNGPFVFDNSVYCDGAFKNQFTNVVTWRKIVLIDVYEQDDGGLRDAATGSLDSTDDWVQMIYPPQMNQFTNPPTPVYTLNPAHNNYPKHVKAFVFPEYHPEMDLEENMNLNLDIDYVLPEEGCTDVSATNYESDADFNDGTCVYPIPGCTDPTALNYDPLATVDDGSCTYPVYTLPPFTFTYGPYSTAFTGQGSPSISTLIDVGYPNNPGDIYAMMMFTIDVQPAINILPNSSGVDYEITELYYIDGTGAQVDIERTTNSSLSTPPYLISPIPPYNISYYFSGSSGITTYPTPTAITASVLLGTPVNIDGVLLPNDLGQGFTFDVYCTVQATDSGAITTSHTEMITITV